MTLQLDARQRAMLAEMGVRVFAPERLSAGGSVPAEASVQAQGLAPGEPAPAQVLAAAAASAATMQSPAPMRAPQEAQAMLRQRLPATESMDWDALAQAVASCRACGLCEGRSNTVFGVGDRQADWLVVGEAPGENEDLQGEPFVGPAGKLLDNMLAALGLNRHQQVYIANVLKCRPPGNRNPQPDEIAQCEPFLRRQVALLQPRIILAMGRFAVQTLLQTSEPIGRLRGRVHSYQDVPVVVTYHPAYLLRNLPEKAKAWADLCLAQQVMREAAGR